MSRRSISLRVYNQKGSILVLSLWSLCLLTVFAVNLGYIVRQKVVLAHSFDERDKLRLVSDAGVKKAIIELKKDKEEKEGLEFPCDALHDRWSNNMGAFKKTKVGDGVFDIYYDYINEESNLPEVRYGLIDEERKININKADESTLRRLFETFSDVGVMKTQALAASIVDWRDKDSSLSIPVGSAEDSDYRGLEYPYEAKDADFEVLDELLLIKDMTGDIFDQIRDYITIYGEGAININTASREVLGILGLDDSIVDKIILFRAGDDGAEGTADDNVFDAHSTIISRLSALYPLSEYEVATLTRIIGGLTTTSGYFMVKGSARLLTGKRASQILCVVNKSGDILYWREQ